MGFVSGSSGPCRGTASLRLVASWWSQDPPGDNGDKAGATASNLWEMLKEQGRSPGSRSWLLPLMLTCDLGRTALAPPHISSAAYWLAMQFMLIMLFIKIRDRNRRRMHFTRSPVKSFSSSQIPFSLICPRKHCLSVAFEVEPGHHGVTGLSQR